MSSLPKGLYQISPEREMYYDIMAYHVKEKNVGMEKDEICKAIYHVKYEDEEEHELNIEYMVQEDGYKSPWKIKDATVETCFKTVMYSSDSDEKPAARKEPIKGSHLGKIVRHSKDGPTDMDPIFTGFGIIGQGGSRYISGGSHIQSIIKGGKT